MSTPGERGADLYAETQQASLGSRKRPAPSPLHQASLRSTSDYSITSPRSPPAGQKSPLSPGVRAASSSADVPRAAAAPPLTIDRLRAPNPARQARRDATQDELRSAVTRDALRDAADTNPSNSQRPEQRIAATPRSEVLAPALQISPLPSPTMTSTTKPVVTNRAAPSLMMPRNPSIDSTVSSVSSTASAAQKVNGTGAYRVSQEASGPEDVASLVAAAGSPSAAIQKLIHEKNQAASHNAQLWRLVEKQRAMILGLNKDLEKSLKEKERYRRKLKENLAQSQSAPLLIAATERPGAPEVREGSLSPVTVDDVPSTAAATNLRDVSIDSRKVSDTSDVASVGPGRSDTPQDASAVLSSVLPATPQSASSSYGTPRDPEKKENIVTSSNALREGSDISSVPPFPQPPSSARTPPMSPRLFDSPYTPYSNLNPYHGHTKNDSNTIPPDGQHNMGQLSSAASPPPDEVPYTSPKSNTSRKAPPAPLKLSSPKKDVPINIENNIIDPSDSEYEEDPASARAEQMNRGRRKTREDDDRERDAIARQEEEYRSRSKKEKKSKSKSQGPEGSREVREDGAGASAPSASKSATWNDQAAGLVASHVATSSGAMLLQRSILDAQGGLPKANTATSLLSPGLPLSPRPGDRPANAPMPRAPTKVVNSLPMSPMAGIAGLPLSPRAPRQPLPMPPQTPLSMASPHLARAETYNQLATSQPVSLAAQMRALDTESPDQERPSTSSGSIPITPGEIYKGYQTEHYPTLLLPPNALPSIFLKISSSRMRPSRQSYIAPRPDENPVFVLAVHERSDNQQLWRLEKTYFALAQLDQQVKTVCAFRDRVPDRTLFSGHAPAKIDARRHALNAYFGRMLEAIVDDKAAMVVCKFLSTDAIGAAERNDYFQSSASDSRPDTPINRLRHRREGYLTKRGKNFGGWKARYFQLDGPLLKYYDDRGGAQLGSIKLQNAQIGKQSNISQNPQEDEDNQFRHAFLILEPKKKDSSSLVRHVLCAESDEERDAWVDVLLQYVDYKEGEDDAIAKSVPTPRPGTSGSYNPRLQRSHNDLRSTTRIGESTEPQPQAQPLLQPQLQPQSQSPSQTAQMRTVGYDDTVPGEAPFIGVSSTQKAEAPSPPSEINFDSASEQSFHPMISGPTNLHVISNTGDWGMKPPPTPLTKDKKRSIFGFRGRSSSDFNEKTSSPGLAPWSDQYQPSGGRAVFGIPLAEAVDIARPVDVDTELPAVVYRCVEYLVVKNAIAEEGIFRLSGSNTVVKALKDRFNAQGDVNLIAEGQYYDIHAVAGLLKLYLRELPASILTRDLHLEFLSCLELPQREKIAALNTLVNKLPRPNRALLEALSVFLLSIVNNAEVNKMNVRNVGIVFAPTLNVPAPLISVFVEDQAVIFGPPIEPADPSNSVYTTRAPAPIDLRSPRKQMFSDLPTPAYNQSTFQSLGGLYGDNSDTGMAPMHPTYAQYHNVAPQGDGGYGSINDALRSPAIFSTAPNGLVSARDAKAKRRESAMLGVSNATSPGLQMKSSMSKLREEEGVRF